MHAPQQRPGHTETGSVSALLMMPLRRSAARWVRRMAGADPPGTGGFGAGEGSP